MRKVIVMITVIGLATAVFAVPLSGQGSAGGAKMNMGGRCMGWLERHPELADELGVDEDQAQALTEIHYQNRKEMVELRADLKLAQIELDRRLQENPVDKEAVLAAVEKLNKGQGALRTAQVEMQLAVREILGTETLEKLRAEIRDMRGRHGREGQYGRNRQGRNQRGFRGERSARRSRRQLYCDDAPEDVME